MGKYIGPKCKLCRREKVDLFLKSGVKAPGAKYKVNVLPGMSTNRISKGRSIFSQQLREKQKVKRLYNMREKQFRKYYKLSSRKAGITSVNLLNLLESRLDNLVYRMGFAKTRAEARQLVSHKGVAVGNYKINIPSYQVKEGERITIINKARSQVRIQESLELKQKKAKNDWLEVDTNRLTGIYNRQPSLDELDLKVNLNLIVELYSK